MKDRIPTYPGRVKLVPVPGQANTYDMTREDQPTQAGDPISKNTLLKDATAALFGLGTTAVPDEVLSRLAGGLASTFTSGNFLFGNGNGGMTSDTPTNAARKLGIGYGSCTTAAATAAKTATITNFVMLTGAIAGIQFNSANTAASPTLNINSLGAKSIINGITNTYITTGDILTGMTAYFQYNGTYWVLLNPATRMVFGTYIGAGAYGSGNPNTLTFNFAPKLVVVQPRSADGIGAGFVWLNGATKATAYSSIGGSGSASYTVTLIWSGTGLSWYSTTDASTQLNFGGNEYAYMALG